MAIRSKCRRRPTRHLRSRHRLGGINDAQSGGAGDSSRFAGIGARYNSATDAWTAMTVTGAPSPRLASALRTGAGLPTFGGHNSPRS